MNEDEAKRIEEALNGEKKTREEALKNSKEQLKKVDQRKDPQIYKEIEEEVNARVNELKEIDKNIKIFNAQKTRMSELDLDGLLKEQEEKGLKLKKVQDALNQVNERKDPQLYAEIQEEILARQKELDEANEKVNNAKQRKQRIENIINALISKYKINNIDQQEQIKNNESKKAETENNNIINDLKVQRDAKKSELDALRKEILANKGEITLEQRDKLIKLKDEIKNLEQQMKDVENGKYQPTIEDKHSGQLKIEDKHASQSKIEDKHKPVGYIEMKEDKHPILHPEVSIEKTGLQIFREQFNEMPELKGRHALSENPFFKLPAALAPAAAAIALTGGIAAGPVLIASVAGGAVFLASKPILKKITGQSKIEKQIANQLREMDDEEFFKMAKYLNEEEIVTLKPHAAILNSLSKVAQERCSERVKEFNVRRQELAKDRDELLQKQASGLITQSELEQLTNVDNEIKEIDSENKELLKLPKEIKRGTQRKSAEYKGNLKGSKLLNLFGKRNHSSKEYGRVLNNYADAERARDEEIAFSEAERQAGKTDEANRRSGFSSQYNKLMQDIMNENTYSKLGMHRSVFNGGINGTSARIISDAKDNTIRNIGIITTAVVGLAKILKNIDQMYEAAEHNANEAQRAVKEQHKNVDSIQSIKKDLSKGLDISDSDLQQAEYSEVATQANAGEMTNVHTYGTVSHTNESYVNADRSVNQAVEQSLNNIGSKNTKGMSFAKKVRAIADYIDQSGKAQDDTAKAMNGMNVMSGVDHTSQEQVMNASNSGKAVEANLLRKLATLSEKISSINPGQKINVSLQKAQKDFLGPAMALLASGISIGKDAVTNLKENRWKKKQDKEIE